jgi:hypothetical protein
MMEKIVKNGFLIEIKYKDRRARTLFSHVLMGRMSYKDKTRRNLKIGYYCKGYLSEIDYTRPSSGKIFISSKILEVYPDIEEFKSLLEVFGDVTIEPSTCDLPTYTAIEYYQKKCEELGYEFTIKNAKRK